MRTTIDIPDELHRRLKAQAAVEGRTIRELVLEFIQAQLGREQSTGKKVTLPLIKAKRKGAFNLTREEIHEAMFG